MNAYQSWLYENPPPSFTRDGITFVKASSKQESTLFAVYVDKLDYFFSENRNCNHCIAAYRKAKNLKEAQIGRMAYEKWELESDAAQLYFLHQLKPALRNASMQGII